MILLRQVPFIYLFTHILINTWETIVCKDHTKLLRSPPPQVSHSASPSSQTPLHPEPGTWLELVWWWTRVSVVSWSQHVSLSWLNHVLITWLYLYLSEIRKISNMLHVIICNKCLIIKWWSCFPKTRQYSCAQEAATNFMLIVILTFFEQNLRERFISLKFCTRNLF